MITVTLTTCVSLIISHYLPSLYYADIKMTLHMCIIFLSIYLHNPLFISRIKSNINSTIPNGYFMYSIITPRTEPSHNSVTLTVVFNYNNIVYVCECESLTAWSGCCGVVCRNGGVYVEVSGNVLEILICVINHHSFSKWYLIC